jgi:YVTN family beta-propeller protein
MKAVVIGVLVFTVAFSIYAGHDAFAHHVLQKIPVSGTPMSMDLSDDLLYVSSFEYPRVSIVDTKNDKDSGFITTSSSGIMDVSVVPDKNKIYVAPFESGGIDVYSLSSKLLIKTIPLPDSDITFMTSLHQAYVSRSNVHFLTGGWSLDYNPTTELLYVADYNSNLVYVIDAKSDTVVETIPVPRHPFTVRADPVSNTIVVASLAGNEISFLEQVPRTSTESIHQIVKTIKVSGAPWGLDIDPTRHLAYVTNRGCACLTVINILEKEVVGNIPLGDKAQAITVDTSEHQMFVSYLTQNKIVKIDGNTNEILSIWDVDSKPWDLAVNPKTHKLYASLKTSDEVAVLGPKSVSISLPAVTAETPATFLDLIYFHGQDVTASDPFVNTETNTLTINLQTEDGGKATVNIPRSVLDAKRTDGSDAKFEVKINDKVTSYDELTPDAKTRALSFQAPPDAQSLTISGTISAQETGESMQNEMTAEHMQGEMTTEPEIIGKDIICQDKVWVENTKGKIACVTPSTAQKLVERGWGNLLE